MGAIQLLIESHKMNTILIKEEDNYLLKTYDWETEEVLDTQYTQDWRLDGCVSEVKNFILLGGNAHITIVEKVHLKIIGYLQLQGQVRSICESSDHMTVFVQNEFANLYAFDTIHNPVKPF